MIAMPLVEHCPKKAAHTDKTKWVRLGNKMYFVHTVTLPLKCEDEVVSVRYSDPRPRFTIELLNHANCEAAIFRATLCHACVLAAVESDIKELISSTQADA